MKDQHLSDNTSPDAWQPITNIVLHLPHAPAPERRPSATLSKGKRRGRRHRGGWKPTNCLTWSQVREIDSIAHEARRGGVPLNWMVTINPSPSPGSSDGRHIERLRRKIHNIQKPTRRCQGKVIALWVFEKQGGRLHAHLLMHIPEGWDGLVTRWRDLPSIDVRKADSRAIEYITKQRRWLGPEIEARLNRRRIDAEPVPGKRWSMSRDLLELANETTLEATPRGPA